MFIRLAHAPWHGLGHSIFGIARHPAVSAIALYSGSGLTAERTNKFSDMLFVFLLL